MQINNNNDNKEFSPAQTGNASNPSPGNTQEQNGNSLLGEKAEKYLREVASIEDVPDAQEQQEMDDKIQDEKNK